MNWEALSAIGELVGAGAVVISLIYLAIQIRQNSKIVAANTFQAISATSSDITLRMAENTELTEIMLVAFENPDQLTPKQVMQTQLFLRAAFRNYENYYYQYRLGYLEPDIWAGFKQTILDHVTRGYGKLWWGAHQVAFGAAFVQYVNAEKSGYSGTKSPWESASERNNENRA